MLPPSLQTTFQFSSHMSRKIYRPIYYPVFYINLFTCTLTASTNTNQRETSPAVLHQAVSTSSTITLLRGFTSVYLLPPKLLKSAVQRYNSLFHCGGSLEASLGILGEKITLSSPPPRTVMSLRGHMAKSFSASVHHP